MALKIMTCSYFCSSALIAPSPALITPLPANIFPNKLAPNVPNNILSERSTQRTFASFLIVVLTPFINKSDYWRDLIIFMISSKSPFGNINVVVPDTMNSHNCC